MKSHKLFSLFAILFLVSNLGAQNAASPKVREIGIGMYNLNSYSLQYRWGNEQRLFRFSGNFEANSSLGTTESSSSRTDSSGNYHYNSSQNTSAPLYLNFGLNFSVLNLKVISEKFGFMYGPLLGLSYYYSTSESNSPYSWSQYESYRSTTSQTLRPYVGLVLGAYYKINNSFFIYGEVGPNIFYAINRTETKGNSRGNSTSQVDNYKSSYNTLGISGLSNSGAMLTLVYRLNH